jgi:hypothetical protein
VKGRIALFRGQNSNAIVASISERREYMITTRIWGFAESKLLSAQARILHSLCREGALGRGHTARLGRQRALCREPKGILSGKTCREASWLSAEGIFKNKKKLDRRLAGPPAGRPGPRQLAPAAATTARTATCTCTSTR